jgi:hypothetical protein
VSGLTNETAYTFTVVATNASGDSNPSVASVEITPHAWAATPDAPTAVRAGSVTGGQVTVTWSAPSNDNGSTILSYTVTSSPGGKTCTSTTTSCTVTGLSASTGYTFTVTATNAMGTGSVSAPSQSSGSPYSLVLGGFTFNGVGYFVDTEDGQVLRVTGSILIDGISIQATVDYHDASNFEVTFSGVITILGTTATVTYGSMSSIDGQVLGAVIADLSTTLGTANFDGSAMIEISDNASSIITASGDLQIAGQTVQAGIDYVDERNWTATVSGTITVLGSTATVTAGTITSTSGTITGSITAALRATLGGGQFNGLATVTVLANATSRTTATGNLIVAGQDL